jgi:hypothetical protein
LVELPGHAVETRVGASRLANLVADRRRRSYRDQQRALSPTPEDSESLGSGLQPE